MDVIACADGKVLPWLWQSSSPFPFPHFPAFTELFVTILFTLSIDLALGYAGIVTFGQAAFFGVGAYAAGLISIHVTPDPILGLLLGTALAALLVASDRNADPAHRGRHLDDADARRRLDIRPASRPAS